MDFISVIYLLFQLLVFRGKDISELEPADLLHLIANIHPSIIRVEIHDGPVLVDELQIVALKSKQRDELVFLVFLDDFVLVRLLRDLLLRVVAQAIVDH